jgi:hypothetical protein
MHWGWWLAGAVVVGGGIAVALNLPELEANAAEVLFRLSLPSNGRPYAEMLLASARKWSPGTGLSPVRFATLFAGIVDHESRFGDFLSPKGPAGTGDNGAGLGLAQIDKNQDPVWARTAAWWDPAVNLDKGSSILAVKLKRFPGNIEAAVAAYNASESRVAAAVAAGKDPQSVTTRGAYVNEVSARLGLIEGRTKAAA